MPLPTAIAKAANLLEKFAAPEGTPLPTPAAPAPVSIRKQCGQWWCWAAVVQAIFARQGEQRLQCEIADDHFKTAGGLGDNPDCCPERGECKGAPDDPCDRPENLTRVLRHLKIAFEGPKYCGSVAMTTLAKEVKSHPVACSFAGGEDPHYCLIGSCVTLAKGYRIDLLDPADGICFTHDIDLPCFVHPEGDRDSKQFYFLR